MFKATLLLCATCDLQNYCKGMLNLLCIHWNEIIHGV